MNISIQCPDREELSALLHGDLSESRMDEIGEHLDRCEDCARLVADQQVDDSQTASVAFSALSTNADSILPVVRERECEEMIARAKAGDGSQSRLKTNQAILRVIQGTPIPDVLGPYRLLEQIGAGGMGTVFKAEHLRLQRVVCLKILAGHRQQDPQATERFMREWVALARLENPHIVRAIDAGEDQGFHYLIMEYVDGVDLAKLVKQVGPLSVPDACEVARQVAVGLQYISEQNLVHRDLKPSNIILSRDGGVRILDLGLALFNEESSSDGLTLDRHVLGTVDFMAPEQAFDSHQVDIRADLYSLGCTLYYLLCGQAPFSGPEFPTALKKLLAHSQGAPPSIKDRRPDAPKKLDALGRQLMAKSPEDRPDNPATVLHDLKSLTSKCDLKQLVAAGISGGASSGAIPVVKLARPSSRHRSKSKLGSALGGRARWLTAIIAAIGLAILAATFPRLKALVAGGEPDPTSGFVLPAPKLATDAEAAGPWQNLLLNRPNPLFFNSSNPAHWWMHDAASNQLRYSTGQAILQLGTTQEKNYEILLTIGAQPWSGSVGAFIGCHPLGPDAWQFQAILVNQMNMPNQAVSYNIQRINENTAKHEKNYGARLEAPVTFNGHGPHRLRLVVRNSKLAGVWLDDTEIPEILDNVDGLTDLNAEYGVGGFGLACERSSGTLLDARFRVLKSSSVK